MRMPRRKYLIGAAALAVLAAGVAEAASTRLHTMKIAGPDGSVVHVAYTGDVAPTVEVVPADAARQAAQVDPFARMDQIAAMMDAQMQAMMQRAALIQHQSRQMQQQALERGEAVQGAPGMTVVSSQGSVLPRGMHVTYYSSSTDASGCTRSTSYSSDGSGAQPKVTQAASDGCDAVKPNTTAIPAKADKPVEQKPAPGQKI